MKVLILILTLGFAFDLQAADSYQVAAGGSQYVAEWGLCATVANAGSRDLFVPTKSATEWLSFLAASVSNVSVTRQACSCRNLLAMGNTTSGTYSIDPDGPGALSSVTVYCDMTTDGGGWTLVGRSVASGSSASFGWSNSTGTAASNATPYSFNVTANNLGFSEILFGEYSSGKTWGTYFYKHTGILKSFISTYTASSYSPASYPTALSGGEAAYEMARYVGHTANSVSFFFRNFSGNTGSNYGLQPNGWAIYIANTDPRSGHINGSQGMIMVR